MRILVTGATSKIGRHLWTQLLQSPQVEEIIALTRNPAVLETEKNKFGSKLTIIQGDLEHPANFLEPISKIDYCIHLAAITHTVNSDDYERINHQATLCLAHLLLQKGCSRFCYISSFTSGLNAGAYGLSKFLAEKELLALNWQELIIIRPAEVIKTGSKEGLDKFLTLAQKFKIYPWLIGTKKIVFAPVTGEEFEKQLLDVILSKSMHPKNVIYNLRGPEISSTELAQMLFKKYKAIPIPVYIPALDFILKVLNYFGIKLIPPDQIPRLLGVKNQKPIPDCEIIDLPTFSQQHNLDRF